MGKISFFLVKRGVGAERKDREGRKKTEVTGHCHGGGPVVLDVVRGMGAVPRQTDVTESAAQHPDVVAFSATPPAILLCDATVQFVTHASPRGAHGESPNPQQPSIPHHGCVNVVVVITRQLADVFVDRVFAIGKPTATASPPAPCPSNVAIV